MSSETERWSTQACHERATENHLIHQMEVYTALARQICQLREWRGLAPDEMVARHARTLASLPPLGQTLRTPQELAVMLPQSFASPEELAVQLQLLARQS